MNRKVLGGVVVAVLVALIIYLVAFRKDATKPAADPKTRSGQIAPVVPPKPTESDHAPSDGPAPKGLPPRWARDVDPEGELPLEGQVIDASGAGVGGAVVWLSSMPPRKATSEPNGEFRFEKLVGRTYSLTAKTATAVGGPVPVKLTGKSDPVIIRLVAGAALEVTVQDDAKAPVAGAEVKLGGLDDDEVARTNDKGVALIAPLQTGWAAVTVTAPGYAANGGFTTVAPGAPAKLAITLHAGHGVSGKVVDDTGKPVAKALVRPAGNWGFDADERGSETDAKGEFQITALAAGKYTLVATDREHAPALSPPVTVGDRAVTKVVITMAAGGIVTGTVVDAAGKPASYATVRASVEQGQAITGEGSHRQATAGKDGAFEIRGLPRTAVQLRAESETAASKVTTVSLDKQQREAKVQLVLDVTGTIAGIVVDEKGVAVPEVQVNAFPDFMGGGGTEDVALAGMSTATTDGGGAFVVRGLPEGPYRLWAGRTTMAREWGQQGVSAKVGDQSVKITLASPGKLVGKLALETGKPPKLASVAAGYQPGVTAVGGAFEVPELTPGQYEVFIRGPEFAQLVKHDVKIEPGKTTDLGTITLVRGRRLAGRVVDGQGNPVPNAKVKVGEMLFNFDGADEQLANIEEMQGIRSAVTDTAGEFAVIGVPSKAMTLAADHPERGRSVGVAIPAGSEDPAFVTLTLRGYGSITGKVTMKGAPQAGVTISASSKTGGAQATFAQSDAEGGFTIAKVPEGQTTVTAMQQKQGGMEFRATSVTVAVIAGKPSTIAIDIPVGAITLSVSVKPLPGNVVDAAQIFLFEGTVNVSSAKQLMEGFVGGAIKGMKFWLGKEPIEFPELSPGPHSVCSVPITGSLSDPTFMQKLQQHTDVLKVYCRTTTLAPTPASQAFVHELPAMVPLPN